LRSYFSNWWYAFNSKLVGGSASFHVYIWRNAEV
jgi:hypothetical protein